MATVTTRYGGNTVYAKVTAVHISSTALAPNTATGFDNTKYPASPAVNYYFTAELAGQDTLRSQVFSPNGGKGYWEGVVFPADGTWTIRVSNVVGDTSVATTTLVVAA